MKKNEHFSVEFRLKALKCVNNKWIQFWIVTEQEQKLTHEEKDNSIANNKYIDGKLEVKTNEEMN